MLRPFTRSAAVQPFSLHKMLWANAIHYYQVATEYVKELYFEWNMYENMYEFFRSF